MRTKNVIRAIGSDGREGAGGDSRFSLQMLRELLSKVVMVAVTGSGCGGAAAFEGGGGGGYW